METSNVGIALIKRFESLRLQSYRDPIGIWTVGYGHTRGAHANMTIDEVEADNLLREDLLVVEEALGSIVRVPLSQNQFDALACWAFNVGCTNAARSTLVRLLNSGDYPGAADELPKWNHAGPQVLAGLTARREAERSLFLQKASA